MFETVLGQPVPKELLENAVRTGNISHAYIFYGPKGVGKTTLAAEFAKSLVCQTHNSCGKCAACRQFYATSDVCILQGESSISVNDVRTITTEIYWKPFQFERKIYIIQDADKMTVQAQNALLKVFEEPPSYAVIILITTNLSKLLPTILSRGTLLRFQPLGKKELSLWFEREQKPIPPDPILNQANGSLSRAIALVESADYREMREIVLRDMVRLLTDRTTKDVIRLYADFLTYEDAFDLLLDIAYSVIYDSVCPAAAPKKNPDISVPPILAGTASAIFGEFAALAKRLLAHAGYGLSVLACFIRIRTYLNEERIS